MTSERKAGVIYQRTEAGDSLLRAGSSALGHVARRILPMIDGRRRLADLPETARPGDLEAAITELQTQGLIRFTGRVEHNAVLSEMRTTGAEEYDEIEALIAAYIDEQEAVDDICIHRDQPMDHSRHLTCDACHIDGLPF